jgi:hypothetical protein
MESKPMLNPLDLQSLVVLAEPSRKAALATGLTVA